MSMKDTGASFDSCLDWKGAISFSSILLKMLWEMGRMAGEGGSLVSVLLRAVFRNQLSCSLLLGTYSCSYSEQPQFSPSKWAGGLIGSCGIFHVPDLVV